MKRRINNKTTLSDMVKQNNIKVLSIDTENMLYTCDDGNDYPLMDGLESLTVEQLQKHLDDAKQTTLKIIEDMEQDNG
jgi:translation elongation factor P/translation initiation factor 5A